MVDRLPIRDDGTIITQLMGDFDKILHPRRPYISVAFRIRPPLPAVRKVPSSNLISSLESLHETAVLFQCLLISVCCACKQHKYAQHSEKLDVFPYFRLFPQMYGLPSSSCQRPNVRGIPVYPQISATVAPRYPEHFLIKTSR